MSDLKSVRNKHEIEIGGEKFEIRFNFGAWARLEEEYGDIREVFEGLQKKPFKNIPILLAAGIVSDPPVKTEHIVKLLEDYGVNDIVGLGDQLKSAISDSVPEPKGKKNPPKAGE